MAWLVTLFIAVCSLSFCEEQVEAAKSDPVSQDLKFILEKAFLSTSSEPLLNMMAMEAMGQSEKKMDSDELVQKFRDSFDAYLDQFSAPYKAIFTAEEIGELQKIYASPVFEKLWLQTAQIYESNFQTLRDAFKEIVEQNGKEAIALNADIIDITQDNYNETVKESTKPLIIDVNASWCHACQMLAPIFEEVSDEYKETIQFAKIDYDSQNELAVKYGVTSLPTILFIKPGKETAAMKNVGFLSKKDFEAKIAQFTKK